MKLLSCTLMGFGKLYRKNYIFSDGIHVIYGENESGKTTLRTFLTGMLFGLERKRGIASKKDEFHKYQPHRGGIYGGTLGFSQEGAVYQVQRNFMDPTDITVYNEKNGKKILSGKELSGRFFSMTKEGYAQTLCISQGSIRTEQSLTRMLNHYLTNMSQSKKSEVNVDQAVAYLRKEIRNLKKQSLDQKAEEIRERIKNETDSRQELESYLHQRENIQTKLQQLEKPLSLWEKIRNWIRKIFGFADQRQLKKQEFEYESRILQYKIEEIQKRQQFNEELRKQYVNIKEQQRTIEYNKKSIEDAIHAILEAAEEIHEEFGSEFQDKVSFITKKITNGTYEKIRIDDAMGIVVEKEGTFLDIDYLSTGTVEQIYFAVRFAAAEILFPDERFPIMLDDVFGNFDKIRLKQTLQYLAGLDRQIFIFSCRKEVMELLEEIKCSYQLIET